MIKGLHRHWKHGSIVEVEGPCLGLSDQEGITYRWVTGPKAGLREWRSVRDWNSRPGGSDGPERFRPLVSTPVLLDPMGLALEVFQDLWPEKRAVIVWVRNHDTPGACYYYKGSPPCVALRSDLRIDEAVSVLLHELAHVATANEAEDHGPQFKAALSELTTLWETRVSQLTAALGKRFGLQRSKNDTETTTTPA